MNFSPEERNSCRRAFTVLELLAAVTAVGVLMALLIPALSNMRTSARAGKCAANLRQIAVAGLQYAQDHDGKFTSSRLYNSSSNPEEPGLKEYMDDNPNHPVFTCPELAHYGVVHTYTLALVATVNTKPGPRALIYRLRVSQPSKTAWMLDGTWLGNPSGDGWFSSYMIPNDSDLSRLVYPHRGLENVLFVDGHVEPVASDRLADRNALIWTGQP